MASAHALRAVPLSKGNKNALKYTNLFLESYRSKSCQLRKFVCKPLKLFSSALQHNLLHYHLHQCFKRITFIVTKLGVKSYITVAYYCTIVHFSDVFDFDPTFVFQRIKFSQEWALITKCFMVNKIHSNIPLKRS